MMLFVDMHAWSWLGVIIFFFSILNDNLGWCNVYVYHDFHDNSKLCDFLMPRQMVQDTQI